MAKDAWKYGAGAAGGFLLNEFVFAGPRIQKARTIGFNEGVAYRESQLAPIIQDLRLQLAGLVRELTASKARVTALQSENSSLKQAIEPSSRKVLPAPK